MACYHVNHNSLVLISIEPFCFQLVLKICNTSLSHFSFSFAFSLFPSAAVIVKKFNICKFALLLCTYPVYKVWAFIISVTKRFTSFPIFHFVWFGAPWCLNFLLFAFDRFCSTCDQTEKNNLILNLMTCKSVYHRPRRYQYLCNISFEKPSYPSLAAHIMFSHLCIENDRSHYSLDIFSDTQPRSLASQDKMPGHHESR